MSNKKHNYTNYSNQKPVEVTAELEETKTEEVEQSDVKTEAESGAENVRVVPILGVVTNCIKLNVRKAPFKDADVACVIPLATEVRVTIEESTEEFYRVSTEAGVEGFCMKKYINIGE